MFSITEHVSNSNICMELVQFKLLKVRYLFMALIGAFFDRKPVLPTVESILRYRHMSLIVLFVLLLPHRST